jgi:hypothetical protein
VLAAVSTRTFHVGASVLRVCLAHRSSASGSSPFGGGGGAMCWGNFKPSNEKAFTNCVSDAVPPSTVSTPVKCRAPQNVRMMPISAAMKPGQKSCRSRLRRVGSRGGCGMRRILKRGRIQIGGDGWESNPPGTLLSPTMVLKTRSATRSPYASETRRRADHRRHYSTMLQHSLRASRQVQL